MQQFISERICQLRKARGLTQEKLGSMLGVTSQAVSKWEKGESFPDILILPELCEILGTTSDALLGGSGTLATDDVMKAFCAYALKQGRSGALLDAASRLFSDTGSCCDGGYLDLGRDYLRIYDPKGMCFAADGQDILEQWLRTDISAIAPLFYILRSEEWMTVLRHFSPDQAVTVADLAERTGMDEDFINRAVYEFLTQGFITAGKDPQGKRGYLQAEAMAGLYLILAGCRLLSETDAGYVRIARTDERFR